MTANHVAIVMDGNGRWAKSKGHSRTIGHQAGVETVRNIVQHAAKTGTKFLTLFSFSTENWKRPKEEVQLLFSLLKRFVRKDLERLHQNNVKVVILGDRENLPKDVRTQLDLVETTTQDNDGLHLNIAFNYGGRDEIVRMVRTLCEKSIDGSLALDSISEKLISNVLDTRGQPDPDLIIRTSGEYRISNFLLWQSAYAEFVFMDVLWPDFTAVDYDFALQEFAKRQRRMGGVVK
jgi:undecaprenyl diphosphate synthase